MEIQGKCGNIRGIDIGSVTTKCVIPREAIIGEPRQTKLIPENAQRRPDMAAGMPALRLKKYKDGFHRLQKDFQEGGQDNRDIRSCRGRLYIIEEKATHIIIGRPGYKSH